MARRLRAAPCRGHWLPQATEDFLRASCAETTARFPPRSHLARKAEKTRKTRGAFSLSTAIQKPRPNSEHLRRRFTHQLELPCNNRLTESGQFKLPNKDGMKS